MVDVYVRDFTRSFTEDDMDAIRKMVDSVELADGGRWLCFSVPLTGECENVVIRELQKTHPNLARKYKEGADVFKVSRVVDEEVVGLTDVLGMVEGDGEEE